MASRPVDWSPVAFQADPTPGDRAMVESLVLHLHKWSERLVHQAETAERVLSTRLDASSSWSGLAADVFRDRLRALASAARDGAGRHKDGAQAATGWLESIGASQRSADGALRDAEEALAELEAAQLSIATLSAEQAALVSLVTALQKAYASTEKPPPGAVAPSHSDLTRARREEQQTSEKLTKARFAAEHAEERLDDARRRATRAKHDYDGAEKAFADALDAALHGALDRAPLSELKAFASAVGKLSDVAGSASVNASLMDALTRLSPDELAALVDQDPDVMQQFWKHPPSPDKVAKWWKTLTPEQRAAYAGAAPGVLGNLAGLPYAIRDGCNRAVYEDLQAHKGELNDKQRKLLTALEKVLGDPSASLVCFNPWAAEPMVAVGYGNLDESDTVTWAAPGMLSDAADATASWSQAARNLYDEQYKADPGRSHAVVAWMGYDTPDLATVNNPSSAQDGAWRFATELDGTHAARTANPAYVTVVAHSYGTTMAADALTHTTYTVDSFTMLGSAGIDTDTVLSLSDLHVKRADGSSAIYTTAAGLDYLAPFGATVSGRAEPNRDATYPALTTVMDGAQSFSSEGTVLPDGEVLKQTKGHSALGGGVDGLNPLNGTAPEGYGYLDQKTESLYNTARTTIGLPRAVAGK